VSRLSELLRAPFVFFVMPSRKEDLVAVHVIREHHAGRALSEILKDAYVTNRLSEKQAARLLDRNDVIEAIGRDMVSAHRDAPAS
jgi:hypothetical protein